MKGIFIGFLHSDLISRLMILVYLLWTHKIDINTPTVLEIVEATHLDARKMNWIFRLIRHSFEFDPLIRFV